MSTERGWVVVTFGGPVDEWCDLNHCPMGAYGPYGTQLEAKIAAASLPEWTRPHILLTRKEIP